VSQSKQNGRNGHTNSAGRSPVLITGGAGFIGTNVARRLLSTGHDVVLLDNLSRAGVDQNAIWLQQQYGARVRVVIGDVRERADIKRALQGVSHVFHFAAQVAVTTSLVDPRTDFEINTVGTMNLLEEMRASSTPPSIIYTSTNKVYGGLDDIRLEQNGHRYSPLAPEIGASGISESRALDFHTPYGCSKGAAEQYVLDYGRSFGVPSVVFRMSCIYGPHQFGTEDQGWVAHFLIRAIENKPITIYGDGMQVRDILFADDLVNAFLLAWRDIRTLSGNAFNIGGGPDRSISLIELLEFAGALHSSKLKVHFNTSRSGDQRYYVSDTRKFQNATGWSPSVTPREGIRRLHNWLLDARRLAPAEVVAS
jgi:CDP-paratose 2-epimerase